MVLKLHACGRGRMICSQMAAGPGWLLILIVGCLRSHLFDEKTNQLISGGKNQFERVAARQDNDVSVHDTPRARRSKAKSKGLQNSKIGREKETIAKTKGAINGMLVEEVGMSGAYDWAIFGQLLFFVSSRDD
ncbi:hypothetical protein LX32DRAFT_30600 [Colletotrichum zoysiae]|uniref:Uncharacterized protein n=1 Tax=Colletotrichum zoysiae TaxID=1216348 RepID=A0AAD9LXP7_9PEZI|nr:hypothetical protein LX32DRAFT_30600 [Colletotrichum zoysiae]